MPRLHHVTCIDMKLEFLKSVIHYMMVTKCIEQYCALKSALLRKHPHNVDQHAR